MSLNLKMKNLIVYVHGKGGRAEEAVHYAELFPFLDVVGLKYKGSVPWEAGKEIGESIARLKTGFDRIIMIANSIGAYFSMNADICSLIEKAFFISPIVDMEKLIHGMMRLANVSEEELKRKQTIRTGFGEDLSFEYLSYAKDHPPVWNAPTEILYGSKDDLTDYQTIAEFSRTHRAGLTVMEGGEHWFHTKEQIKFLDKWLTNDPLLSELSKGD